ISRPEAVAVARDDRKAGDFRVADKVVDLAALHPGAAIIVGAGIDEAGRPWLGQQASGEILRVDALVDRSLGIAPDLPRRGRALQLILKPRLLLCAEDGLRRHILLRVRDARLPEREFGGRIAAIEGAAPVEDLLEVLGEPATIGCPIAQLVERIVAERVRTVVAVLIGDDEIEVLAVPECAVAYQAVDRDQVIRLIAKAVFVPLLDFDIGDRWRFEMFPGCPARLLAARREIFPPGLVGSDLDALSRPRDAAGLLNALPSLPGKFVIVPHRDERPARAGVLQVGVREIAFVNGPIALDRQREVKMANLATVRNARDLVNRAVVACLHFLGIFD